MILPAISAKSIALVIPAKNEATTVGAVIESFGIALSDLGFQDVACIVVDDHSTDHTASTAARVGARVLSLRQDFGLASAFRLGMRAAVDGGADVIVHVDADGQYLAHDLPAMFSTYLSGADLVVGNRLWRQPPRMTYGRYLANRIASAAISQITGDAISDTQSGFRVFSAQLAADLAVKGDFTYTQEQLLRASHGGYTLAETAVTFMPRTSGSSRLVKSSVDYAARVVPHLVRTLHELRGGGPID